jgi:hypothetical protein
MILIFSIFLTDVGCGGGGSGVRVPGNDFPTVPEELGSHTGHFQLLLISVPITADNELARSGNIKPSFSTRGLHLISKLIIGFTNARNIFLYFFCLHFSSMVSL